MREQYKPKQDFEGLELYSDNEDLYNPIANRRKARTKKTTKTIHVDSDGEGDKGSDYKKSEGSDSDSGDSDVSEGTQNAKKLERERERMKRNPIKSLKCLECNKIWSDRKNLKRHMVDVHKQQDFKIAMENYHNLPEVKSVKNYCIFCTKGFPQDQIAYQIHINMVHGGKEPDVNYDVDKMKEFMSKNAPTKRQMNIVRNMVCLECGKGYVDAPALRRHMKEVHKVENFTAADENYVNLPEVQSAIFRCFPCTKTFNKLGYRLHIKHKHNSTEPPENFDPVKLLQYENLTKMMVCLVCQTRLGDPYALKKHMLDAHDKENYEVEDDNYYNLPTVRSTQNLCMPCSRLFAKSVLYRLHIKNKHSSIEPEQNVDLTPQSRMSTLSNTTNILKQNLPPSLKIKLVKPEKKPKLEKNWMCAQCKKCFKDQTFLRKHMQEIHKLEPLSLTKEDYLELPSVESTLNRCLPCNKTFPNNLRYKIHIKDSHDKTEPVENYDAENCAQPEDFICLICVKKFVARNSLRLHINNVHLGITKNMEEDKNTEQDESQVKKEKEDDPNKSTEEQDPLADPLDVSEIKSKVDSQEDVPHKEMTDMTARISDQNVDSDVTDIKLKVDSQEDVSPENISVMTAPISENNVDSARNENHETKKVEGSENLDVQSMDVDNVEETKKETEHDLASEEKRISAMDVDNNDMNDVDTTNKEIKEDVKTEKVVELVKEVKNKDDDEIIILEEENKKSVPTKVLTEKEQKLVAKMLHMLKKYGCAFCANRFDTKHSLSFHERTHLKEKKSPKKAPTTPKKPKNLDDTASPGTPKVKKNTKMGSVQLHDNTSGPVCFKCSQVCKDNSNYKNHILSHYYREFDPHIPQTKPFECPICSKPSRDKITLIRHYAFTHQKIFELTDITPEQLIPAGTGTPKTPKPKVKKALADVTGDMTPKIGSGSPSGTDSPAIAESNASREASVEAEAEKPELDSKNNEVVEKEEVKENLEEESSKDEEKEVAIVNRISAEEAMQTENDPSQNGRTSDVEHDNEKELCDKDSKLGGLQSDLSDNKENEEEVT